MRKSKWILLAEDDEIDAELALRSLVPATGETVVLVTDGLKALDCLYRRGEFALREAGHPAMVLLDIKMPKVDGLEVLRQIKADPRLRAIPVVMFTSSREDTDVNTCYQQGANAYVVKPVAISEFRSALQQVKAFWMTLNELPEDGPIGPKPKISNLAAA